VRCCPSSGNLHPTEANLVLPPDPDLPSDVYHYLAQDHAQEQRSSLESAVGERLAESLPEDAFLLGLTSIPSRSPSSPARPASTSRLCAWSRSSGSSTRWAP